MHCPIISRVLPFAWVAGGTAAKENTSCQRSLSRLKST